VRRILCDARPQKIRTLAPHGEAAHLTIGRAREYPADAWTAGSEEYIPRLRQQQLQRTAGTIRHQLIALEADRLSRRATQWVARSSAVVVATAGCAEDSAAAAACATHKCPRRAMLEC